MMSQTVGQHINIVAEGPIDQYNLIVLINVTVLFM